MAEVGTAWVTIVPSARGFGKALDGQVGGAAAASGATSGKRFSAGFGSAVKAGLAVAAGAAAVNLVKGAISEAREAQVVGAKTNAIIRATGGAAQVSAGHVGALAASISQKVGIDDEAIQTGSNLLLTFKNVRNEAGKGNKVFDQATQAAVDLSSAGFGSIESASVMLGKALNDPEKGMTALGRAGVTFTKTQKEQVKALVASGDLLGAQKIILGEVQSQVGGTAAASATASDKMGVAFGNLQESIGTALLPTIDKLLAGLTTFFEFLSAHQGVVKAIALVFAGIAIAFAVAFVAANALAIGIGIAIGLIVAGLVWAWKNCETFRKVATAVFKAIAAYAKVQFTILKTVVTVAVKIIVATFNAIKKIPGIVSGAWNAVKSATTRVWGTVLTFIKSIPGKITGFFSGLAGDMLDIGTNIADGLLRGVQGAWHRVSSWIRDAVNAIPAPIRKALGISSPSKVMIEIGGFISEGLAVGIAGGQSDLMRTVDGVAASLSGSFSPDLGGTRATGVVPVSVVNIRDFDGRSARVADSRIAAESAYVRNR